MGKLVNLQNYQCHKRVLAFEIGKIEGCKLFENGSDDAFVEVSPEYISRNPLNQEGYYVRYEDGYESFSPKAVFEAGYNRSLHMGVISDEAAEDILSKLPGDRVTKEYIEGRISEIGHSIIPDTTVTICHIQLDNGFSVRGESACVDPNNFNKTLGEKYSYEDAFKKLWPLFGFLLAENRAVKRALFETGRAVEEGPDPYSIAGHLTDYFVSNDLIPESSDFDVMQAISLALKNFKAKILSEMQAAATNSLRSVDEIARVCHEVNRAYCLALGDDSQPTWEDAPDWQKQSAFMGVNLHLGNPGAGPEASHESWSVQKIADGWVYGEAKDPELKTHPCLVPFDQLPKEQQAKDFLFRGVVHALAGRS